MTLRNANCCGRERAIGARAPLHQAQRPNQICVLDFMSDVLETGRRFRVFNVEDQLTREGLAAEVDTSLPGPRVVRTLDRIAAERGKPEMIVSDNGTELTGNAMLKWAEDNSVEWHYIAPGKPQQNGFMESFKRHAEGRVPERACVLLARPSAPHHRSLAHRLQHRSPAFEPPNSVCRSGFQLGIAARRSSSSQ
jgi:putative transposase